MFYLPTADTNNNIEVLDVKNPHKLYSIPDGETGCCGVQWHVATRREKRGQVAADDGQDGQARYLHPYIRRLEEGTVRPEGAIF
jgi:hypothetical protein